MRKERAPGQGSRQRPACTYQKNYAALVSGQLDFGLAWWRGGGVWPSEIGAPTGEGYRQKITSPYGAHHQSSYILDMGSVAAPSGLSISIHLSRVIVC